MFEQDEELTVLKTQISPYSWRRVKMSKIKYGWTFRLPAKRNIEIFYQPTKYSTTSCFKRLKKKKINQLYCFWFYESCGCCFNIKMNSNSFKPQTHTCTHLTAKAAKYRRWRTERRADTFPRLKAELKTTVLQMRK